MAEAFGMYAASVTDSNMFYATRFSAPDPFVFLQIDGKKILVMSDLELGRAQEQAAVDEVLALSHVEKESGGKAPSDVMKHILLARGARVLTVPENFWASLADDLRERGIEVKVKRGVFWEKRETKTPQEIAWIEESLRVTAEAIELARKVLSESKIEKGRLVWKKKPLTSEILRGVMNARMASRGCVAKDTIVAGGDQACDPHHIGSGALAANVPIVVDVFPRSVETMYWGDMTRTFVKGKASAEVKRMFGAVREGQELGYSLVRSGAQGVEIHRAITELFEKMGYVTELRGGKMVGFFHGTGHGLGLDIHEAPSIGRRGTELKTGAVVTVEPGLYYVGTGGIRIEDVVVVEDGGCRKISRCATELEID